MSSNEVRYQLKQTSNSKTVRFCFHIFLTLVYVVAFNQCEYDCLSVRTPLEFGGALQRLLHLRLLLSRADVGSPFPLALPFADQTQLPHIFAAEYGPQTSACASCKDRSSAATSKAPRQEAIGKKGISGLSPSIRQSSVKRKPTAHGKR